MIRNHRRRATLVLCALLAQLVSMSGPVAAGGSPLWTFPGNCPTATLQDCIDAATPGDTVQIATNTPILEFVEIEKSLTLRAAAGFHPTISYGGAVNGMSGTVSVTLRDLTFNGNVEVDFSGGSGHVFVAKHIQVIDDSSSSGDGLSLQSSVFAAFAVVGSFIDVNGYQNPQLSLYANGSANVTFRIFGNRLKGAGASTGGGGIDLASTGSASLRGDIFNNVIWDSAGCNCGGESGIFIDPQSTGQTDVNVVGNTFDRVHSNAIALANDDVSGGHLSLDVFNNAVTRAEDSAVYLGDTAGDPFTYRAGYNDFYGNGRASVLLGHSAGVANLHKAPGYTDTATGNYRLKSSSPLVNAGQVCSPGGVANPDADGKSRLAGASVDIGAYERGAGKAGVALVGTGAGDTLIGGATNDIICGYAGADFIDGAGGNDYLRGGPDADFIVGGPGSDVLFGDSGSDTLCTRDGGHGNDKLNGGSGNDGFKADSGDVRSSVEHAANCAVA